MADGINNELDFEKRIKEMEDRQLLEFVARTSYDICQQCVREDKRITALENGDRKQSGIVSGVTSLITSVVIGVITYFTTRKD